LKNRFVNLISIGFFTFVIVFSSLLGIASLFSHLNSNIKADADVYTTDTTTCPFVYKELTEEEKQDTKKLQYAQNLSAGYGSLGFCIYTAEGMYDFAYWYSKKTDKDSYFTVKLMNNIDMSNAVDSDGNQLSYYPIENFYGSFDGQGHIIKNLTISQSNQRTCEFGLFKSIYGDSENTCEVKNLYLSDCKINIVNCCYARTENYLNELYIGSIAGYALNTEFTNVQVVGNSEIKESSVSSVIYPILNKSPKTNKDESLSEFNSLINLCSAYGNMGDDFTGFGLYSRYIGGVAGRADLCSFSNCYSTVKIDVKSNDEMYKRNSDGYIDKLSFSREYKISNDVYAGGLAAYSYDSDFSLCEYSGKLYAQGVTKTVAGGIVGILNGSDVSIYKIENCCNNAEVTGDVIFHYKKNTSEIKKLTNIVRDIDGMRGWYTDDELNRIGVALFAQPSTWVRNRGEHVYRLQYCSDKNIEVLSYESEDKNIYLGGICGYLNNSNNIKKCYNSGQIYTKNTFSIQTYEFRIPVLYAYDLTYCKPFTETTENGTIDVLTQNTIYNLYYFLQVIPKYVGTIVGYGDDQYIIDCFSNEVYINFSFTNSMLFSCNHSTNSIGGDGCLVTHLEGKSSNVYEQKYNIITQDLIRNKYGYLEELTLLSNVYYTCPKKGTTEGYGQDGKKEYNITTFKNQSDLEYLYQGNSGLNYIYTESDLINKYDTNIWFADAKGNLHLREFSWLGSVV